MREALFDMINSAWMSQTIAVACELDIADRLAAGPRAAAALAAETGTHAPSMRRFLRALCTLGICEEQDDGGFGLAEEGQWLRREQPGSAHAWAVMSSRRLWTLWGDLREGLRTGESVRRRRRGFDDFGDLEADPAMAGIFNQAMVCVTQPVAAAVLEHVPFAEGSRIVDVGGGPGELLAALLAGHGSVRGEVYDLGHARAYAEETFRQHGVADRARFVEGSFFDAVPAGAGAYLLKSVLHNWDDERAAQIVQRCAAAMGEGSRLLVIERIVPQRLSLSAPDREVARSDLQMLLGCDGRERTLAEFEALFAAAGLGPACVMPLTMGFSLLAL